MPRRTKSGAKTSADGDALRALPSVDTLTSDVDIRAVANVSDSILTAVVREELAIVRAEIRYGVRPSSRDVGDRIIRRLAQLVQPRLTPVINGTGVIVHTNLGRAPVSRQTAAAMVVAAEGYVPVEIDLATGSRGGRMAEISRLMRVLTGADATLVVNNNAAAVLLVLSALATGREVIVSRGEAVEIGGGFRIPDVLRQSGATLVEVGTTNRTYPGDYAKAVTSQTALMLKVHPSNFTIAGFTRSVKVAELAALDLPSPVPIVEDVGSGALIDTSRFELGAEPTIAESLAAGASVVTASGDKLLGGPQAGIISGRTDLIERIATHPLARAVRADKTCLAGTAETLRHYLRGDAEREIPVWRMISAPGLELERRSRALAQELIARNVSVNPVEMRSTIGGGSLPGQTLASWGLDVDPPDGTGVTAVSAMLRAVNPPVIARIQDDRLLVDLRTVLPEDDERLTAAIVQAVTAGASVCGCDGPKGVVDS